MKKQIHIRNLGFFAIALIVSLFTFNSCNNDDDSGTTPVEVLEDIQAKISANRGFAIQGETINFEFAHDTIPNNISSYEWTFEGGSPESSSEATPSVTYNTVGTFEASLALTRASDGKVFTGVYDVRVFEEAPDVAFMADATTIEQGQKVTFRSMSTSTNIYWTFEGGTPDPDIDPQAEEQVVTYLTGGTFDVSLYVAENGDANTVTETDYIEVTALPLASFTTTATTINQRESITFTNTTPTDGASIEWTFEGVDIGTSTDNEVTHTYAEAGVFNATLKVTKNGITLEESVTITVVDIPTMLVSAESDNVGSKITLVFDESLNDPSGDVAAMSIAENGTDLPIASIAFDGTDSEDKTLIVTLSFPITIEGAAVTVNYTPTITNAAGEAIAPLVDEPIVNNYIDFCVPRSITEQVVNPDPAAVIVRTFDISCVTNATLAVLVESPDPGNFEDSDFINITYSVDGGAEQTVLDVVNAFNGTIPDIDNIQGDSLQLTITADTSFTNEIYNITAAVSESPINLFPKGDFEGVTTVQYKVGDSFLGSGNTDAIVADFPDGVGVGGSRALEYVVTGAVDGDSKTIFGDGDSSNFQEVTGIVDGATYTIKAMIKFTGAKPVKFEFGMIKLPFSGSTIIHADMDLSAVNADEDFVEVIGSFTAGGGYNDVPGSGNPNEGYSNPRLTPGAGDSTVTVDNIRVFRD